MNALGRPRPKKHSFLELCHWHWVKTKLCDVALTQTYTHMYPINPWRMLPYAYVVVSVHTIHLVTVLRMQVGSVRYLDVLEESRLNRDQRSLLTLMNSFHLLLRISNSPRFFVFRYKFYLIFITFAVYLRLGQFLKFPPPPPKSDTCVPPPTQTSVYSPSSIRVKPSSPSTPSTPPKICP